MHKIRGKFITFEGVEGSGKTTQLSRAADFLQGHRVPCLTTAEPGGSPLGQKIRQLLLYESLTQITPEAELLLFGAARAQHVRETILPALMSGTWVLCDRFTDASLAYQGYGRGIEQGFIKALNRFASSAIVPDLTILLDLPAEIGLKRIGERSLLKKGIAAGDRIEQETISFHQRIREGYLSLAQAQRDRFRIIDATQDIDTVHHEIIFHLEGLMKV